MCRFHVAAGAGSASYQNPVSNNLQMWFLSTTGRLNFGFITEGKLTAVLITPSSWGSQLIRQHRTITRISNLLPTSPFALRFRYLGAELKNLNCQSTISSLLKISNVNNSLM
jgi:hypothetical protein